MVRRVGFYSVVEEDCQTLGLKTSYLVECYDPADPGDKFEFLLPREECACEKLYAATCLAILASRFLDE